MKRTWTDEAFIEAVSSSTSIAQVARALGLKDRGGNYKTIKNHVVRLGLDTAHWKGQGWLAGTHTRTGKIQSFDDILIENSTYTNTARLKLRLFGCGLLKEKCYQCGITEWLDQPISLHLDHKNGNNTDNRLVNLRILCPNCHSQTDTYCGRNIGRT